MLTAVSLFRYVTGLCCNGWLPLSTCHGVLCSASSFHIFHCLLLYVYNGSSVLEDLYVQWKIFGPFNLRNIYACNML
uniref:Uncharacterized protein n=1 Tax=Arundo donax TaxID=35708 RepID=A0A0A9GA57_ARUDO